MRKRSGGNKGISLAELIVTIAIAAIVSIAVMGFLGVSIRNYRRTNAETSVQYEAQLTDNQIHDMLIDVTAGLSYKSAGEEGSRVRKLYFYDWDDSSGVKKNIISIITWKEADKEMQYVSYEFTGSETEDAQQTNAMLMAEYVTDFEVTKLPNDTDASKQVSYSLTFEKDGRTYSTQNTVSLRNDVKVNNQEIDAVFADIEELNSTVTSVEISPASPDALIQGGSMTFTAKVNGENWPSQKVIWSLSEEADSRPADTNTKIDASSGVLTLGSNETSQNIKVIATSAKSLKDNGNVQDEAEKASVTVVARYMSSADFTRTTIDNGRSQAARLEMKGRNFPAVSGFSPEISYTATDGSGKALSGVTVSQGALTAGTQTEDYYYDLTVSCDDTVPYETDVTVTAAIAYGPFSASKSITFNTGRRLSPITGISIRGANGSELGNDVTLDRGATQSMDVWIERDGTWSKADSSAGVSWDYQYSGYGSSTGYAEWPDTSDGASGWVKARKDPEALPYYSTDGRVSVSVTVSDKTGGAPDLSKEINIDMAKVTVTLKPAYPGTNTYTDAAFGGVVALTGKTTGIVLESSDVLWSDYYDNVFSFTTESVAADGSISAKAYMMTSGYSYSLLYLDITKKTSSGSYSYGGVYTSCYLNNHTANVAASSGYYYVEKNSLPSYYNFTSGQYVTYGTFTLCDGTTGTYQYYYVRSSKKLTYYIILNNVRYKLTDYGLSYKWNKA